MIRAVYEKDCVYKHRMEKKLSHKCISLCEMKRRVKVKFSVRI